MAEDRLDNLTRTDQVDQHQKHVRYSKRVRRLRLVLPFLAVVAMAIVFSWDVIKPEQVSTAIPAPDDLKKIVKNEFIAPRFSSRDDDNRPYLITADRAFQSERDQAIVLLENPSGEITVGSETRIDEFGSNQNAMIGIHSKTGEFHQTLQTLKLQDDVKIAHSDGYTLDTRLLHIDIEHGRLHTDQAVYVEGQTMSLNASGMTGLQVDETIRFTGPVRLILKKGFGDAF
jgi:lipopolysaccharide export system protein LptC